MKQGNIEERFHKEFKTIWIKTQCSQIGLNPNIGRKSYLVNPNEVLAFIKQEMEGLKMEKLIDKEFLGWGRQEFEDAIDTTDDAALLREFDTHNALVDKFNERINETN